LNSLFGSQFGLLLNSHVTATRNTSACLLKSSTALCSRTGNSPPTRSLRRNACFKQRAASDRPDRWFTFPTGNSFGWDEFKNLSLPLIQEKHMKLKYIAAAVAMMASAASQADILSTSNSAGSELFLVVYYDTAAATDKSYTFDTGITTNTFLAANNSSQLWATLNSSDANWVSFLASAGTNQLQYAVLGGNANQTPTNSIPTQAVFSTVTVGNEGSVAGTTTNSVLTNGSGAVNGVIPGFLGFVNQVGGHVPLGANGSSVSSEGSGSYFQDANTANFNAKLTFNNNNNVGTNSEFTALYRTAGGINTTKASELVMPGVVSFAQSGNDYVLSYTVAAVPEASGYAMALAGFGFMGLVAIRRKRQ
jgi:hypothetical protein